MVECINDALLNGYVGKLLPKYLCSFPETNATLSLRQSFVQSITVNAETHNWMKY